jgi:hypothetical protein
MKTGQSWVSGLSMRLPQATKYATQYATKYAAKSVTTQQ